ncbi:MAG: M28 family peptidase [Massilia sp.]
MKPSHLTALVAIAFACLSGHANAAITVDGKALLGDVRVLSSEAFAGRRTGTEGSRLAQAYLTKRFEQLGLKSFDGGYAMPFSFTVKNRKQVETNYPSATNLVGFIPGTLNPERYLVVSAHYDHLGVREGVIYPGADDNASGVAAMLAIADYFRQHPPRHTIVFAAFDGEELGLQGGIAFVKKLPFARDKLVMDLNLDMVSRNDNNEIWAAGLHHYPALTEIVTAAASRTKVKLKMGHDVPVPSKADDDWTFSSDHGPFHEANVPFLYFGVEDHADYHKPGDTFDKIKPAFFTQVAELLVDVAVTADQKLDPVK